eukprot:m.91247 g.91247  ORF g.91247 m.91247 type:complete len:243 (-) comp8487_c1_seq8:1152-1880(-)
MSSFRRQTMHGGISGRRKRADKAAGKGKRTGGKFEGGRIMIYDIIVMLGRIKGWIKPRTPRKTARLHRCGDLKWILDAVKVARRTRSPDDPEITEDQVNAVEALLTAYKDVCPSTTCGHNAATPPPAPATITQPAAATPGARSAATAASSASDRDDPDYDYEADMQATLEDIQHDEEYEDPDRWDEDDDLFDSNELTVLLAESTEPLPSYVQVPAGARNAEDYFCVEDGANFNPDSDSEDNE